jgi:hypothetical protein
MSGKTGKRETGHKPSGTIRTSVKDHGAFGKERVDQLETEVERNVDKAVAKKIKLKVK